MATEQAQKTPVLYYHVGMGKVASTYLRQAFFPKLKGGYAIPRSKKYDTLDLMAKAEHDKYLLTRALDTNMEDGIQEIGEAYPDQTYPIIVFRRADSWIGSQYRRFVKNGYPGSLQQFVDVHNNQGFWPREELLFMDKIRLLERYFNNRPLVLFYEDMKADPRSFFDAIANYTGCTYDFDDIQLSSIHTSHNPKGLIFRRQVRRWVSDKMPTYTRIPVLHWLQRRWLMVWAYFLVAIGKRLPWSWLDAEELMDKSYLEEVRAFTQTDWAELKAYAAETHRLLANR